MDIETKSVEFLEWHIQYSFPVLFDEKILLDMEWEEGYDGGENWIRPVGRMGKPTDSEEVNDPTNIICLFPPFFPSRPNNYYKELLKQ